jgi:hypothetical protein
MNLIGNAVKFTAHGFVRVNCSVEESVSAEGEVTLKFEIRYVACRNRSRSSRDLLAVTPELACQPLTWNNSLSLSSKLT